MQRKQNPGNEFFLIAINSKNNTQEEEGKRE